MAARKCAAALFASHRVETMQHIALSNKNGESKFDENLKTKMMMMMSLTASPKQGKRNL